MLTLKLTPEEQTAVYEALNFVAEQGAIRSFDAAKPLISVKDQLEASQEMHRFRNSAIEAKKKAAGAK